MSETIGIIGLGAMGAPLARHVIASGREVVAFDVDDAALASAEAAGATPAANAADLATRAGFVIITVGPGSRVHDVLAAPEVGFLAGAPSGSLVAISSTLGATECMRLAELCRTSGVTLIDAPLVGGTHAVEAGTAISYVGGDPADVERARGVYEAFCSRFVRVGGHGAGQTGKLASNTLYWGSLTAIVEVLALARELGVDPDELVHALELGPARNFVIDTWNRPRAMTWCDEDMAILHDEATTHGVAMPLADTLRAAVGDIRRQKNDAGMQADSVGAWVRSRPSEDAPPPSEDYA